MGRPHIIFSRPALLYFFMAAPLQKIQDKILSNILRIRDIMMGKNETGHISSFGDGMSEGLTPLGNKITILVLVSIITTALWYSIAYLTSPLRKYPGPFLGGKSKIFPRVCDSLSNLDVAWTNFYRMYYAYKGNMHIISKELHNKYGPVVRMAPNYLDIDETSLIKTCFDIHGVWQKVRPLEPFIESI